MIPYQMRGKFDCGPASLSAVTGRPYDEVCRAMSWDNHEDLQDNPHDTPWNHFSALAKLGIPWKIRTCGDILSGIAKPQKTMILIHALPGEDLVGQLNPLFVQHWVILDDISDACVWLHMGNGKEPRRYSVEDFKRLYSGALPACAYEIGIGSTKLTWYQRFYAYLTNKFI